MTFFTSKNPGDLKNLGQPVYLASPYLKTQSYHHFHACISEEILLPFEIQNSLAISLPKSPFGSAYGRDVEETAWNSFLADALKSLASTGINAVRINHPSPIYSNFIPEKVLLESGFKIAYKDINQHVKLEPTWEGNIHSMQKRKLEKLEQGGFEFKKMQSEEFKVAYDFVKVCRETQGLKINIAWDHFAKLRDAIPNAYHAFGVFRDGRVSAVCIAVEVTPKIAYYYLPATSPMFRSESPMVMLIAGMVDYYRSKGFDYLDLGVSSQQGKPQETLRIFKERMGAHETTKPTYLLDVHANA